MIMLGNKKRYVSQVLGPDPREKGEEQTPLSDIDAISSDILQAIEAKDAQSLASALKAFHYACQSEEMSEEE